ncbi:hypothetical protein X945_5861 [Burkholderia pseudomallei ABCPW 107]|nr:hypothetical protein X945_5861 [Burkholderia pseudomallei ABCPW 107]KGW98486.1 hypothetical protein Y034_6062 [Burkholderia pseudomallei MSHR449]
MRCKWEWLSFSIHSIESPLTDCLNDRTYALYYAHVAPHQRYRTRQPFQSRSGHDAGRIGKGRHEARRRKRRAARGEQRRVAARPKPCEHRA